MPDFDPNAPISVLDAPATVAPAPKASVAFDPTAPVVPEGPTFDPTKPVEPEHAYVTKTLTDATLSPAEKQSRISAYNEGLSKFDFDSPVTPIERFGLHEMQAAGDTLPALGVKAVQAFSDQPFQATPLPLRLAQAQVDALQREKDRRAGSLGDVLGDPTYAEYPDSVLNSELTKAQARVQKFMTPANVAAMAAEKTRIADVAAKAQGEKESFANLPDAQGAVQKVAAGVGELAGGLTDPTNFLPLGEAAEGSGVLKRILTTGKEVAGQSAVTELPRQTLAVGANQPDQTGALPAAEHVATGFLGGMVFHTGSEALGKVVSMFKGVKAEDIAGKTAEEAAPIIAAKTGQDPAAVAEQLKTVMPAKPEVAAAATKPSTSTLSLNPEDKPAVKFDPDAPVQPEGTPPLEQPKVSFSDASGRVETSEDAGPQEGDKYQYSVQRPQPIPNTDLTSPGYTQVDVIRNGDSVQSSNPETLRAQGHDVPDVPDHLPQGRYSREEVQAAIDNPPAAAPAEVVPPKVAALAPEPNPTADALRDAMGKGLQREADAAQGQHVLDTLEERGETPHSVIDTFWKETYDKLTPVQQQKFQRYIQRETGMAPGDTVGVNADKTPDIAKTWQDVYPAQGTFPLSQLEGTERGLVALMGTANEVTKSMPAVEAPVPKGLIEGSPLKTWADQVVANYGKQTNVNMTGGMDLFAALVIKGAAKLERGVTDFAKWSAEMVKDFGEEIKPHLENLFRVARELHEQGRDVANASPEDVKDFLADYRNSDHAKIANDNVRETTPATRTEALHSSILNEDGEEIGPQLRKVASDVAPKTHALSEDSGVALVRYAAAREAAPKIAAAHAGVVLGSHIHDEDFANKLGGVLVEDRLKGIRAGLLSQAQKAAQSGDPIAAQEFLDHAQNVTSIIGKKDSPFATPADYKKALEDPEIQAALQRHKDTVQPIAQKQHEDLGGRIAQAGPDTGAFANLEPLDKDGNPISGPKGKGSRKGDLTAPRMKGSVNNQRAFGTADNYETDYNKIAQSMISGNFEETAKRQMYDQLTKDGLAVIMPPSPGTPPPDINGRSPKKLEIERRGLPSGGGPRTLVRNLWVDPKIYPEIHATMGLGETFKGAPFMDTLRNEGLMQALKEAGISHVANVANALQLKGPVNALFHTANLISSIAGQQGGESVVSDLVRKLPGVNVVDSLNKIRLRARDIVADSPQIRQEIAKLSQIGAGRAPFEGAGATSRFLQLIDHAARLVRNDLYDNMVERGWAKDSEQARRDFINKVGVYNPRLMGQVQRMAKDLGISPFLVAGQSFNRQALSRVTGAPGITPKSTMASVGMRAVELGGLAATLFGVPMAINYALNKQAFGRPGTPLGAIDTGKTDSKGNAVTIDPQQWTGVRRGLRLTGANAVATGIMKGQSRGEMIDNAGRDIVGGFLHPFAGPLVNTAVTATTGYNASFYKQATKAKPGESQLAQNAIAAVKQLNPMAGNSLQGTNPSNQPAGTLQDLRGGRYGEAAEGMLKGAVKPLLDAAGVKSTAIQTPEDQVKALAGRFTDSLGVSRDAGGQQSPYSDLSKAVHTGDMEAAKAELDKVLQAKADQVPGNLTTATKLAIAKREIAEYYNREQRAPFTGNLAHERAFKGTLDGDQQVLYSQAKTERRDAAQTVRALLYRH